MKPPLNPALRPGQLSPNFWLAELCVSSKADSLGVRNVPTAAHLANIVDHLVPGLEQIRAMCGGRPVLISSAYRNPEVNAAVGGTPTSAHPQGFASDLGIAGLSSLAVARIIAGEMKARRIAIDQMIWESGREVVHVSFDPRARMMAGHQPGKPGSDINWRYFA